MEIGKKEPVVSKNDYIALKLKKQSKVDRRAEKLADNASLAQAVSGNGPSLPENGQDSPLPVKQSKSLKSKPRRKKSLFVRLRNQLDKECQSYAVKRDEAKGCRIRKAAQCTGKSEVGYHLLPRGKWGVRWDLDFMGVGNIVGACAPCNAGERWHRLDYGERHRELFGDDFYEALWQRSKEPYHYTSLDLGKKLEDVRNRREALDSGNHKC